jgi:eukaryotic-like serine/threonine-protein kinase
MVMGTPSYMSPEQCQGQTVDRRSDLFSAAVVLYELLAGEKPFSGALETIGYKICHEDPKPPSTVSRLALSPTIDAVVATALEKNPETRFQNAKAFNRALRQACDTLVADDALGATEINLAAVRMGPPPTAPDWDETTLRTVERQLAKYVGPMARVMIRKAAAQTRDVSQLYALLAESISDAGGRQRFIDGTPGSSTSPRIVATGQTAQTQALPLDKDFVDQTTMRLAAYLGPIAKVVVNRAAQKASSQHEFVQLVADHLGSKERGAFLREIGFQER